MENVNKNEMVNENKKVNKKRVGQLERRAQTIKIRVNTDEIQKINENAKSVNMNVSEYIREMAINKKIKVVKRRKIEIDMDILGQMRKIGVNLNQLLKFLYSTKTQYMTYEEVLECLSMLFKINEIYNKILEKLK